MSHTVDNTASASQGHAVVELTEENFAKVIADNTVVFVDFWAPWCAPCRAFAPIYEGVARKYPEVVFAKVNVDEQSALAGHYHIRAIPSVYVFVNRSLAHTHGGGLTAAALEKLVNAVIPS